MKLIYIFLFLSFYGYSQSPFGDWYANLKAADLTLVFHIKKEGKNTTITVDSPKQKAFDMPAEISVSKDNELRIEMKNLGVLFEGVYYPDSITGIFQQGVIVENMTFYKEIRENKERKRPQNPKPPYNYGIEDVKFMNLKDSFYLAGTLTLPLTQRPSPGIVLVSGSGPQNRDEEIMGHKPFWVLADYLSNLGYAVLRYDDRGTHESKGTFNSATTLDLALDAESAVEYLKHREDVDASKIVVMGHSEGGMICNILGARIEDLSGIISLAGTSIRGDSILQIQTRLIAESKNVSELELDITQNYNKEIFKAIVSSSSSADAMVDMKKISKKWTKTMHKNNIIKKREKKEVVHSVEQTMLNPWMYEFVKYSPSKDIKKINCNVLVIIGSKDIQVTSKENIDGYKNLLPKNRKLQTVKELKGLNHLFQKCTTCTVSEYGQLEETFSMDAMEEVRDFLEEIWQ
ncbi:alpha/beta fold hydrolase [Crocinitomicaceae bacterium]|nr:alpha/beta fold hydrolase [Crocinitomicaceae bacterium]